jgi:hypothetical protein
MPVRKGRKVAPCPLERAELGRPMPVRKGRKVAPCLMPVRKGRKSKATRHSERSPHAR